MTQPRISQRKWIDRCMNSTCTMRVIISTDRILKIEELQKRGTIMYPFAVNIQVTVIVKILNLSKECFFVPGLLSLSTLPGQILSSW